jgi:hypothetical protein
MYRVFMIVVGEGQVLDAGMWWLFCFFFLGFRLDDPPPNGLLIAEVHAERHLGCDYLAKLRALMRQQTEHVMLLAYFFLGK